MKNLLLILFFTLYAIMARAQVHTLPSSCSGPGTGNWQALGPFNDGSYGTNTNYPHLCEGMGRIISLWVEPSHSNHILAGANCGGLWETDDDGAHWHNKTDGAGGNAILGMEGVSCIAVCPADHNIIYLSLTSDGQNGKGATYGLGLVCSTDGGATWHLDNGFNALAGNASGITKLAYNPGSQELFAVIAGSVLYKASPSSSWTDITPPGSSGIWWQCLQFSHTSSGVAFLCSNTTSTGAAYIYKHTSSGTWSHDSFTSATYGSTTYTFDNIARFTLTSSDDALMCVQAHIGSAPALSSNLLVKSPASTASPVIINTSFDYWPVTDPVIQGSITQFEVSQSDPNILYMSYVGELGSDYPASILQSTDGGVTVNVYPGPGHPDGRCLYIYSTVSGLDGLYDQVFLGTDGGVREKKPGTPYFESITGEGLTISQFYGIGNTEADEDYMAGGTQDDGGYSYNKHLAAPWANYKVGDAYTTKFMGLGSTKAIGEYNDQDAAGDFALYRLSFSPTSVYKTSNIAPPDLAHNTNRPQRSDRSNNVYIGYGNIWKLTPGATVWTKAYANDPGDFLTGTPLVSDFYIDENNPDIVYIIYHGVTGPGGSNVLYYSIDATTPTPAWHQIPFVSAGTPYDFALNSIAVDPKNSDRIFVCFGSLHAGNLGIDPALMDNRVWYSSNHGTTWSDISTGLPALPVNKLLYVHGVSGTQLFAGTDAGVYKWDETAAKWNCFNNGLPVCTVMDMEINYCANKLRIATYGRGMWETPLDDAIPIAEAPLTVISGTTTWHTDMYLQQAVTVKAGGNLTISNCTIHMPKNAVIAVEPNGKLTVNNSTITNDCENCWWQGIEARGQALLKQDGAYQGWVIIKNHSVIKHARIGVSNCNAQVGWASDGGIIQCTDAKFINNNVDVSFSTYDNFWPDGVLHPNISSFTNCTFLVDNQYKGDAMGLMYKKNYMVLLKSVEGINFSGCSYINRNTHANKLTGDGIHSINSAFNVLASCPTGFLCSTPFVRSRFCGLTHGIVVAGLWQPTLKATIDNADFDSCSIGVDVFKFNDVATTRCKFLIGNGMRTDSLQSNTYVGCHQNIGILVQNSQRYRVEDNTFIGLPNPYYVGWYNIGAAITTNNSLLESIYRNTFGTNLSLGVVGVGLSPGASGLRVSCNTFKNNALDILSCNNSTTSLHEGLCKYQNIYGSTAGNTFSGSGSNILNNCVSTVIFYYYHGGVSSENPSTTPGTGAVMVSPGTIFNNCTPGPLPGSSGSSPGTGGMGGTALAAHKSNYYQLSGLLRDSTNAYNNLIDFGNTQSLISAIDNSASQQQLYSYLSSGSPYLSTAALQEVAVQSALPYADFMQLLKQNPDDLRDDAFYNTIKNAYNFQSNDSDSVQVWSQIVTPRTMTESFIGETQFAISSELSTIIGALKSATDSNVNVNDTTGQGICTDSNSVYFMQDSATVYSGIDSLDAWLAHQGGFDAQLERVGYYAWRGQYQMASQILNSISPSSNEETQSYNTYLKVANILYGAKQAGRNEYELTENESAKLNKIGSYGFTANSGALTAYSFARLSGASGPAVHLPDMEGPPCIAIADRSGGFVTSGITKPVINNRNEFSAHPNPSAGIVTFTYNIPDGGGNVDITITTVKGEKIAELHTGNNTGNANWNPGNTPPGTYLYRATCKNGTIATGQLILLNKN